MCLRESGKNNEYTAIATDAVPDEEKQALADELKREATSDISIRVLVAPKTDKEVFSLSAIIDDWLKDIRTSEGGFVVGITLPVAASMIQELGGILLNAWKELSKAA